VKIYALDDYIGFRNIYHELLGAETFSDALGLLDSIALEKPDLFICDLIMPDMDGWSVIEKVRAMCPDLPIIVSTSSDTKENIFLAEMYNCDFWPKGTDLKQLIKKAGKYGFDTSRFDD
jgi:CheY-like chemotaxis protein